MVTILQLNRLELKDMILNEIAENPVLEEAAEVGEELTPAEVESLLEREREAEPVDEANAEQVEQPEPASSAPIADEPSNSDAGPFEKIDVDSHFDQYLDLGSRQVEPDVYVTKEGDEYIITLNDRNVPQLRLNAEYKRMIDREQEPNKDVRNYVKERYASALQLIKNIEHRKQTILSVCQSIVRRQGDLLEHGIDHLKPMMIKDIAEEMRAHPSTVSRAVANKAAHTPQGVFELRNFFSEAVQGPSGNATPLLIVKRRVKKMIEEEDSAHPLTDEQMTARLQTEGIEVTRRIVAKYREDMQIPPADQRRQ